MQIPQYIIYPSPNMLFTYITYIVFAILAILSSTRTATTQPTTEPNTKPKSSANDVDFDALLQKSIYLQVGGTSILHTAEDETPTST